MLWLPFRRGPVGYAETSGVDPVHDACSEKEGPLSFPRIAHFAAATVAVGLFNCASDRPMEPPMDPVLKVEAGQLFPDIVLPSLEDGSPASLAQFRGKKVLLHVFASW